MGLKLGIDGWGTDGKKDSPYSRKRPPTTSPALARRHHHSRWHHLLTSRQTIQLSGNKWEPRA